MTEGEGFQIVIWDVINKKKADKCKHKGEYINSGQVILKTINLEQVSLILEKVELTLFVGLNPTPIYKL